MKCNNKASKDSSLNSTSTNVKLTLTCQSLETCITNHHSISKRLNTFAILPPEPYNLLYMKFAVFKFTSSPHISPVEAHNWFGLLICPKIKTIQNPQQPTTGETLLCKSLQSGLHEPPQYEWMRLRWDYFMEHWNELSCASQNRRARGHSSLGTAAAGQQAHTGGGVWWGWALVKVELIVIVKGRVSGWGGYVIVSLGLRMLAWHCCGVWFCGSAVRYSISCQRLVMSPALIPAVTTIHRLQ